MANTAQITMIAVTSAFFCLGTNGGQLVFRSDQSFIQRIDCSLKCGLCRRNLSFQYGLIGFACCIKCRLGSSQRVAQCFDLIVQRFVAVCNGFVEFCFGIIKILLHLIDCSLQCGLCRRNLSFQCGPIKPTTIVS